MRRCALFLALTALAVAGRATTPSPRPRERPAVESADRLVAPTSPRLAETEEPVRQELIRLQRQFGLTLVTIEFGGIQFVNFARGSLEKIRNYPHAGLIAPDGSRVAAFMNLGMGGYLGITRADGSDLREFSGIVNPYDMCWSYDKKKLAVRARVYKNSKYQPLALWILDLASGSIEEIGADGHLTSQCWSPDGSRLAYTDEEFNSTGGKSEVHVFEPQTRGRSVLAKGVNATWSPDANWIAFYDRDTYYAVRPSGSDKKKLFKKKNAESGLWWSPDCRIVAFVSQAGLFEGQLPTIDVEVYWLRARRLSDNSEARIAPGEAKSYQWMVNPEFIPR
jgi:WD40-like Beta Propeller Repeat